jgi:cytochrome oxidase Cu insertion factor (SCO1/SenC/PrrC family)
MVLSVKERGFKISAVLLIFLLSGCLSQAPAETPSPNGGTAPLKAWMDMELTDVATGQKFRISEFKGTPVLVESFAVWCPTCTEQQKQTRELKNRVGDEVVHVSLDTDPNEDEVAVRTHIEENSFDWYYAVSPIELTRALIDDFGNKIIFAPGVPMVLICPDQSNRLLPGGIKSPDDMLSEIEEGC